MNETCCKPCFTVIGVDTATAGFVTLTVNPALDNIAVNNTCFKLCLTSCMIPANNTDQIQITDGTTTLPVRRCDGNFLRADSLRRFLLKKADCCCCVTVFLEAFRGNDDAHITIFNRMPRSSFVAVAAAAD